MELNRRQFLEGAGAAAAGVAAMGALSGAALADEAAPAAADVMTADKYAGTTWSFEVAPEPIPEDQISQTYTHDIVIVGAGMAGVCCAVAAAEKGADVILFSASSRAISRGGSNHAIGSRYQAEMGIDYNPQAARKIVKAEQTAGTYLMDKKKWARWINNSAESIDWTIDLMEAKGLKCSLEPGFPDPDGVIDVPPASHNFWNDEQPFGALFGAPIEAQTYAQIFTEDLGGEIHYNTVAKYLIRDDDNTGRVSAVIAQDADGNYHRFKAPAVVLSCGGYGANNAMYRELQQGQRDLFDAHGLDISTMHTQGFGRDGSGIKMGMWAGGSMDPLMRTLISPEVVYTSDKYSVNILIRQGTYRFALWLDPDLERFCDESFMGCYSLIDQMERNKPGRYYAFFDNKQETLMSRSAPEHFCASSSDDALTQKLAHWLERGELGEETEGQSGETTWSTGTPCHFAANTWEELFSYMGLDEEEAAKAKAQIDRYNELAAAGKDEDFGRDPRILLPIDEPPFYGIIQVQEKPALGTVTLNGLVIDHRQRVLDKGYNPILGLYASGNNGGGRWGNHYSTPIQGVSLGMALTLGRVLGKQLCEDAE